MPDSEILKQRLQEIEDLKNVAERLWFDQQTHMPAGAIQERIRQTGLIQDLINERVTSPELGQLLDAAPDDLPWIDVARADRAAALRLGDDTWRRFLQVGAEAFDVWEKARRDDEWEPFAPWLDRMVEINRDMAEKIGYDEHPMDALLSVYAPGPTHAEIADVIGSLRSFLIEARTEREIEEFEPEPQGAPHLLMEIAEDIGRMIGFDFERGGIAFSPHGYTSTAGPNDIRISFRKDVPLFEAVSTIVHEYGHALYSQGVDESLWGTPAQSGSMPYIQESQAKFWENIVGRREDFCMLVGGILAHRLGGRTADEWGREYHRALTRAPSSPIRIATDEISFNLHIALRFEIEESLLSGAVTAIDVPTVWNEKSEEYLGIIPSSLKEGALQDPHWTRRFFGLFTAYVIGNVSSAQLAQAMEEQGVSLADASSNGDFSGVLAWLRNNVHAKGRAVSIQEVLESATGRRLDAEPYVDHLRSRYDID